MKKKTNKKTTFFVAQNIDCEFRLELPYKGDSYEYPRKTPAFPLYTCIIRVSRGDTFHKHVIMMYTL